MLRTDRGGEFTSSKFTQYCKENGIARVARIETDFEEVFAPVARMETVSLLLTIAANNKWEVHHLDVKSAFLHGDLKEEICVTQPEGFIKRQDNGNVYRLIKALYGLRQAPHLVYGYLCGPITPPTPSGKKYIFLLVDDDSRYMWVYFLTTKDQACDTFKEYKNSIENELRTTLKMLRTDRGREFTSSEFTQYCKENGISRVARIEIDFEEVFAPVARMETVRLLLAIAANNKWEVHHLDVKSAFLHGDLKEEVCVTQPEGFIKRQDNGKVYRLIKALYGLRQAPRAWNIKLDNTLNSLNFKKCALEQAIDTKTSKDSTLLIGVYVDDLIITGTPKEEIDKFKIQMEEKFEMSDLGLLAYYLGIEVTQTNDDISIKQSAYANKILKEAKMIDCNETWIQMDPGTRLTKVAKGTMNSSQQLQQQHKHYGSRDY
nr:ribonuclease H-like domain, reverse transcriptase, RNA-dependent DNA polymerase [Tanacetum cinerariifolium]